MSVEPAAAALAQQLAERLRRRSPTIPAAPDGPTPVSAEQEQLLYHVWFAAGSPVYNECITLVHRGRLDVAAVRTALDGLVARYDVWHSVFRRTRGRLEQVLVPSTGCDLPVYDSRGAAAGALAERVSANALAPYDLRAGPLLRPLLARTGDDEHRLYLALHHLVFDGVSLYRVVLPEFIALYEAAQAGTVADLGPATSYRDYASWQAGGVLDAELARHLPYWRQRLAGAPELDLPLAHPRPAVRDFHGTTEWFTVEAPVVAGLRALGHRSGATLFHVLAAAYALLLRDLTGQTDLVLGTVADRRRRRELERMVGYCLTPLPLRLAVPWDVTVDKLVGTVRAEVLDALTHNIPFERIVADLDPPQTEGANPVFQAMIVLEPPASVRGHPAWSMQQLDADVGARLGQAKNDLQLELDERDDGHLSGRLIVNRDLFDDGFAARQVTDLLGILASFTVG